MPGSRAPCALEEWECRRTPGSSAPASFGLPSAGGGSRLAIERIHEALAEIRVVTRREPATAAEGAVLFLEKLSPALRHVDSSTGALGNATCAAVQELAPLIPYAFFSGTERTSDFPD